MADDKKRLLDVKANLKKKQPKFIRQDAHKKSKLASKWRKPTGLHNKIGDNRKGYRKHLKGGYQTPVVVRGQTKDGLFPVIVTSVNFEDFDPKVHTLVVSGKLGGKKKAVVIEAGLKAGFTFLNASKERADKIKADFEAQSKSKKERDQEREKKQKELEKEAEESEKKKDSEETSKPTEALEKKIEKEVKADEKPTVKKEESTKESPKKPKTQQGTKANVNSKDSLEPKPSEKK